jgi:Carboxypeptidase regulatory-like domain
MVNPIARPLGYARLCALVLCAALVPAWASAQWIRPSITGVVTDSSGAVLPGVTVEVASPVLIERARSTVTDGRGSYRIIELDAGTYTVTFMLPGFNTVRRDGVVSRAR